MLETNHKTNLKFKLYVETEDVDKEEEIISDFNVNIEELYELVLFFRNNNIDPKTIKFSDIARSEDTPTIINQLYDNACDIAFKKHLKHLMWTKRDFYDEADFLTYTDDLDVNFAHYNMNTNCCDSDEEYYDKLRINEGITDAYQSRYEQSIKLLKHSIIADDLIEFDGILCELV